jgi:hypothetical protein
MIKMVRGVALGALLALVVSCGWLQGLIKKPVKPEKDDVRPHSVLVGRIASISSHGGFALIQSYGAWSVVQGTALWSGDEDHIAALQVTGEKLGQFAAADIRSGTPTVGDAVYQRKTPDHKQADQAPATAKPTAKAESPGKPEQSGGRNEVRKTGDDVPGVPQLPESR